MQLMYVVDLDVDGDDAFARILDHAARWLSNHDVRLDAADFATSGNRALSTARTPNGDFARQGTWEVLDLPGHRAVKLQISQAMGTDLEVTTRVTVTEIQGAVHFRVGIGRETIRQRLVPVGTTDIYQPGILGSLDRDMHLALRARGQLVNGRYLPVKTAVEASAVAEVLSVENRLPLAIIHVRSTETWDIAGQLSRKLLGLVRTVTVNFDTARAIREAHPEAEVPFGGLAIVWPGFGAPSLRYTAEQLSTLGVDTVHHDLTRRIGGLAALGNGEDTEWRRVKAIAEKARLDELSLLAVKAREGGDKEGEISALKQQIEALQEAADELETIGEEALQQADANARLAQQFESERDLSRDEVRMWQNLYQDLSSGTPSASQTPVDPWTTIPTLVSHSDPQATYLAISDAASGGIVFTERAQKSWMNISYPEPDDMTDKLIAIARAAVALYDGEDRSIAHLDVWLKENFGLTVALTDQTITKWKKKEMRWLNAFEHEGEILNATPHVKVRDAVKLNECGRIHFALEPKKGRLVVQHVGIKTYE